MNRYILKILLLGFISWGFTANAQETEQDNRAVKSDSLLETYSIEELMKYRDYYKSEIDELERKRKDLRQKGIRDAEDYLKNNPNSRILDKVIMRLAELYYQKANDRFIEAPGG